MPTMHHDDGIGPLCGGGVLGGGGAREPGGALGSVEHTDARLGTATAGAPTRDDAALAIERARVRLLNDDTTEGGAAFWTWDLMAQRLDLQRSPDPTAGPIRCMDPAEWILEVHEDDRARVVEALHAVVDGRLERVEVSHRLRRSERIPVAVTTRATLVRDARGAAHAVVGVTCDVDARARREAQRRAHVRRLEAIAGVSRAVGRSALSLPEIFEDVARSIASFVGGLCAVRLLDDERRVLEAPAALVHIDPRRRMAVLETLGHPQPVASSVLAQVIETGACVQVDGADLAGRFRGFVDEDPPQVVVLVPLRTSDGVVGVLVAGRDIGPAFTDEDMLVLQELGDVAGRAIANARLLARAERLLRVTETFVGVLGHDLRNPLGAIATCAHLVQRGDDVDKHRRAAARIERSAARMSRMIEQLLDFTRMRVGRLALERTPVDAAAVCSDVMEELRAVHPRRDIRLRVLGDARGAWDACRLGQLISNLVGNAIDHGEPDVPITVILDGVPRELVRLDVHSGGAITAARLATIFEPMGSRSTVGDRRAARRSGLGLGLFIVKQIALAHGGDASVTSSSGAGTTFSVTLPRL